MFYYYCKADQISRVYPYDVLVFNNAFIGLWAALRSSAPTIGMINDEKNIKTSLADFQPNRPWFKQFLFRIPEKASVRRHSGIITNSDFLRERVLSAYQVPEERVKRLYKAIDLSLIQSRQERTFGSPVRILFVKADFEVGRLDVLIQALRNLPRYEFWLTVIGPGRQFEKRIINLSEGIRNIQLNYLGPQPQNVVYEYLQSHDIFCVPSHTEALGVANIEALASGISVISTNTGGIPEVLDNGLNGWLVEPGSADDLAKAIEDCINSPQKRIEKGIRGREFVIRFSKENMFREFLKIMEDICGYWHHSKTRQPAGTTGM
jgi:glycosyltransferase involved in cell wall biosynthesis